jgi:hypothetical protein
MFDFLVRISQHVPFVSLISALLLGAVMGLVARNKLVMAGAMIRYLMLLAVGVTGLWEFVLHVFFPVSSASVLGIASSGFQVEVALANLGLALAGIWAFKGGFDAWVAVAIMLTCFSAGSALLFLWHAIFQQVAPTGHFFYADILTVFVVDMLLAYYYLLRNKVSTLPE